MFLGAFQVAATQEIILSVDFLHNKEAYYIILVCD